MPAVSQAQQNFFRLVNAYKKGGLKKSEVSPSVVSAAKEMSKKTIGDFLKLKKGAPEKAPMNRSMEDMLPEVDMAESIYEDITIEDILKFQAIMDMLDNADNSAPTRSGKYMRI